MWGRVLETRRRNGVKWRRYRDEAGVVTTTCEVPEAVLSELGVKGLQEALARASRKRERLARNTKALALLDQGWKPLAVAHEVGLSESQVRKIRRQAESQSRRRSR